MIIIFHVLFNICRSFIEKYKRQSLTGEILVLKEIEIEENLLFDPPVYKQRYGAIHSILLNNPWQNSIKKMVDFGCAEFQLFSFVKSFYRINEILEVDIDYDLLKDHLYRIRPLTADYLTRRIEPLTVYVLQGSITDPDYRLLGVDFVVGIELIEHLYPNELDALPYNVFSFIKPKIAVFTTPNADFNVLFPNFKGFRHYDHKFEWSREQFESWALNITTRYPDYSVRFEGIGEGPRGTEHLGCCSQMAVFTKICLPESDESLTETTSFGVCRYNSYSELAYCPINNNGSYYTLIETIEYPYEIDDSTTEEKLLNELKYRILQKSNINGRFYNDTSNRFEIPVSELIYGYNSISTSELEVREILENANYKIEQCTIYDQLEDCVVFEPEMDESQSSTPTSSPDIVDSSFEDLNSGWSTFNTADDDPWDTNSDYQKSWLTENPSFSDSSEAVKDIVDDLINNLFLPDDKPKPTNGISLYIANDMQKLVPLPERKLKINLKSPPLAGFSEAGPSYAKKRKKKLHEDDNESLIDVFKNAEMESILNEENCKVVELNDADGEGSDNSVNYLNSKLIQNIGLQNVTLNEMEDTNSGLEVDAASHEALFDPNSVIELPDLDDLAENTNNGNADGSPNFVLIGINVEAPENAIDGPVLPANADPFPNWLLHMLGAEVIAEDVPHDEPHFYCQGDGVGVHPSFIEGEFEEDHSSSGSDSSSHESNESGTVSNDAAEAEPTVSEVEVVSLPDDGATEPAVDSAVNEQPLTPGTSTENSDEFYDTVDEPVPTNTSTTEEVKNSTTTTANN